MSAQHATPKTFGQERREPELLSKLLARLERQAVELERGMTARLQLVESRDDLQDELQVERQACDHKEKERHALALEVDRLNAMVLDLTRQVELSRLSVESMIELDKLRREEIDKIKGEAEAYQKLANARYTTISEQAREIERLKSPKITLGGTDIPVKLDPALKPDEWRLRYPGASSYPPPIPLASYRVEVATRIGEIKAFYGDDGKWHRSDNGDVINNVISWS